jgi:7-cyano-7-deazaguanine reductase
MEKEPSYKDLEVVDNEYLDRDYNINVSIPEFNCVCPRTGLPDFATIKIQYIPDRYIIELKSLKLYMVKFRNLGIFHEHVTNRILDDLVRAAKPKKINIVGEFHPRGGVKTSVDANWEK